MSVGLGASNSVGKVRRYVVGCICHLYQHGRLTSKITMFPVHANSNMHSNWAMSVAKPGHPLIRTWGEELETVYDRTGPEKIQLSTLAVLVELWNNPIPPPLHSKIHLLQSIDGPMYHRFHYSIEEFSTDGTALSQATAHDLATRPLRFDTLDRCFLKLVGNRSSPGVDVSRERLLSGWQCPRSTLPNPA
jgi:hypothetical protein